MISDFSVFTYPRWVDITKTGILDMRGHSIKILKITMKRCRILETGEAQNRTCTLRPSAKYPAARGSLSLWCSVCICEMADCSTLRSNCPAELVLDPTQVESLTPDFGT